VPQIQGFSYEVHNEAVTINWRNCLGSCYDCLIYRLVSVSVSLTALTTLPKWMPHASVI